VLGRARTPSGRGRLVATRRRGRPRRNPRDTVVREQRPRRSVGRRVRSRPRRQRRPAYDARSGLYDPHRRLVLRYAAGGALDRSGSVSRPICARWVSLRGPADMPLRPFNHRDRTRLPPQRSTCRPTRRPTFSPSMLPCDRTYCNRRTAVRWPTPCRRILSLTVALTRSIATDGYPRLRFVCISGRGTDLG